MLVLKSIPPLGFAGGGDAHGLYLQKNLTRGSSNEGTPMLKSISNNSERGEIERERRCQERTYLRSSQRAPFISGIVRVL